jgi:hypothetical protein
VFENGINRGYFSAKDKGIRDARMNESKRKSKGINGDIKVVK